MLHQDGMGIREIGRRLNLSRNTVRTAIKYSGQKPDCIRKDKQHIDEELLTKLYGECEGHVQRVFEKLQEEEGIDVKYSTLTRMLRELGIGTQRKKRCDRVPDEPGAEMQHDTTIYTVKLGERKVSVVASLLYLRYSKMRYLKFYPTFNRFNMKCFIHESLMYWGYSAPVCIIDNTNLARLRGTGKDAVIVPEMVEFSKQYGFEFCCHAINHPNRKAGEERGFWTVETNFLPGRNFVSLEDLNQQALLWATERFANRPQSRTKLIPAKAFEFERLHLTQLPPHIPAPYLIHDRVTDQYGFISFAGNYYWVPGTTRDSVRVLQYSDTLKLYQAKKCVANYNLPANGVKNQKFSPEGQPTSPYQPKNRKKPYREQEDRLRAISKTVGKYIDFILNTKGLQRYELIRKLELLSRNITPELFIRSIERAHKYEITNFDTIERIVTLCLTQGYSGELPIIEINQTFEQRTSYLEGSLTDLPDLSVYEDLLEENYDGKEKE